MRQIHALPAARYEVAVFDGGTIRRVWRARQIMMSLAWLKHRNARGGHVYVRPATTACVLVENVTAETLAAMAADGLAPAAVVEAAPERLEAWFRLGLEPTRQLGVCVAQVLAARYGRDPGSVDVRRLGRAAGFTNRTSELVDGDGRYPRVRVVEARGRVTPRAEELVAEAAERLRRKAERRAERVRRVADGSEGKVAWNGAEAFLAQELERIVRRYGAATDRNRAQAAAARRMAMAGYTRAEVAAALAACPDVRRGKGGRAGEYADRTAAWAFGEARRRAR